MKKAKSAQPKRSPAKCMWSNKTAALYLRRKWGKISPRQIAADLREQFPGFDVTRNAVIGKAHRLGLCTPSQARRAR